jgi:hypothetical protein
MRTLVAAALGAGLVAAGSAPASDTARAPRVLATSATPIHEVIQEGKWLAWREYCEGQRITVKPPRRPPARFDTCGIHPTGSEEFAFAGGRVIWNVSASGNTYYDDVYTAAPGRKVRPLMHLESDSGEAYGKNLGGMAGDGATLVFSTVNLSPDESTCDPDGFHCEAVVSGGGVWRVRGIRRSRVPSAPPTWTVAAHRGSIAVVPAKEDGRGIEVRLVSTGRRTLRLEASDRVDTVALSSSHVAALLRPKHGRRGLEIFDRGRGEKVETASVPAGTTKISISGRRVVYRAGHAIRLLDAETGRNRVLVVSNRIVSPPSIEGNQVAWGSRERRRYAIRAIDL